ncbi:hypothetical protein [Falsiruegeria mediterranea]|uniref:Uncharacterized protein n=1 Tax=Falsiruegeria mediterranea M17 TaxID=1200281 RepID=A0A2R8CB11_9RHOB|nr:hypothetical protein [Falsiruegeria mediterranea]SPJ29585.1 hypothetical protein TRM7615_03105 [Falsiruegeria mediterranea M17]
MVTGFHDRGWVRFPVDPATLAWVQSALPAARTSVTDPAHAQWLDCEGTWFIGVDALPNDPSGCVDGQTPLAGAAIDFIEQEYGMQPLHRGQVSVIYPGYPKARRGENEAALRYRRNRDAAHVDGLKPSGPDRRRHVDEPHSWILGLPLTEASPTAAPMVVWEGSHTIMADAFGTVLAGHDPALMHQVDVTEAYQSARREVFETCPRIEVFAQPGEAYVLHRHCLHGVAPWGDDATAGPDGRMIAYFRPDMQSGVAGWIEFP